MKTMNTIVVLLALCICVGAMTLKELQIKLHYVQRICKTEFDIDEQKADDVNEATFDVQDVKSQIYSKCIIEEFNGVDENKRLNENVVRDVVSIYLDENDVNQLIAECSLISDTNIYLRFSKLMMCLEKYKTMKEIINL
ncbi:uncharacterized protein LOC100872137 [Apis florea]|uniref:uncharacterized protein LOC100872137 n=1 Tax=Apis florea TaxID=7463 RepID=UPI000252C090|nr:uncharacterized protein LOC100872137 [Apis florea]